MSTRCAAPWGAASFEALPDDLVLAVLKALPLADRYGCAAPVCRRFRALATHPSLLHDVRLTVWESLSQRSGSAADVQLAAKLGSLCTFLVRHAAPHLRRFQLRLDQTQDAMPCEATCAALKTLLFRLAAHCSAYGALEEVSIKGWNVVLPLVPHCFTPLAPTLRRLRYDVGHEQDVFDLDFVAPNLAALTGLQELWVTGREQQLHDDTVFPPNLTRLHLGCFDCFGLPATMSTLKHLRYLSLAYCPLQDEALAPLTALTQLTLEACFHIPASLSQLTQLRVLRIDGSPQYDEEQAEAREALLAALLQLQSLTHLALGNMNWLGGVPAEVGSLAQLARFCYHTCVWQEMPDPLLPAGAWLSSLRQLALPIDVAAASLQRLMAAQQLECLAIQPYRFPRNYDVPTESERQQRSMHQAALLAWAAQHPRLSSLALGDDAPALLFSWRAALALARWPGRPPLAIVSSQPFFEELGCIPSI